MTDGTRAPVREIGDDATAEVAERAREQLWFGVAMLLMYVVGAAMLVLEPWTWSAWVWLGATALLLAILGLLVWRFSTVRGRAGLAGRLLAEYAVLRSVDPGAGRRAPTDQVARKLIRSERFLGWFYALGMTGYPLLVGQWERPEWAVPGAVLLVGATALMATGVERQARAARRWLADPPGPPRD